MAFGIRATHPAARLPLIGRFGRFCDVIRPTRRWRTERYAPSGRRSTPQWNGLGREVASRRLGSRVPLVLLIVHHVLMLDFAGRLGVADDCRREPSPSR
jgi:hypothetical protein